MTLFLDDMDDPIAPDRIHHGCDEIHAAPGKLSQSHSYLDHRFSQGALVLTGRAYTDTMWKVAMDAPEQVTGRADPATRRAWWPLRDAVLGCLIRRYPVAAERAAAGGVIWLDRGAPQLQAWFGDDAARLARGSTQGPGR